jgi:hypothetical protein
MHLDNYLKVRYNQDFTLLKHMSEENPILDELDNPVNPPSVYNHSVFGNHTISNLKNLAHNFKKYQEKMDLAYLSITVDRKLTKTQLLDAFKTVLKNQIHSFAFSQLFATVGPDKYYRYAGSYKPLSYYDIAIQNLLK